MKTGHLSCGHWWSITLRTERKSALADTWTCKKRFVWLQRISAHMTSKIVCKVSSAGIIKKLVCFIKVKCICKCQWNNISACNVINTYPKYNNNYIYNNNNYYYFHHYYNYYYNYFYNHNH